MAPASESLQRRLRLGKGPFIFHGAPPVCSGEVEIINESPDEISVRTLTAKAVGKPVARSGVSTVRVGSRLAPGQKARIRAKLDIDRYTPPGTYELVVMDGDEEVPLVVHVWEKQDLKVDPLPICLRGAAGQKLRTIVVVSNEGNVVESLNEVAPVYLEETDWLCRARVFALHRTKEGEGFQAFLDNLVAELKSALPGKARVSVHTNVTELRPGDTRDIEVEITLPRGMSLGRKYSGSSKFMSGELKFRVECIGPANSPKGARDE